MNTTRRLRTPLRLVVVLLRLGPAPFLPRSSITTPMLISTTAPFPAPTTSTRHQTPSHHAPTRHLALPARRIYTRVTASIPPTSMNMAMDTDMNMNTPVARHHHRKHIAKNAFAVNSSVIVVIVRIRIPVTMMLLPYRRIRSLSIRIVEAM